MERKDELVIHFLLGGIEVSSDADVFFDAVRLTWRKKQRVEVGKSSRGSSAGLGVNRPMPNRTKNCTAGLSIHISLSNLLRGRV